MACSITLRSPASYVPCLRAFATPLQATIYSIVPRVANIQRFANNWCLPMTCRESFSAERSPYQSQGHCGSGAASGWVATGANHHLNLRPSSSDSSVKPAQRPLCITQPQFPWLQVELVCAATLSQLRSKLPLKARSRMEGSKASEFGNGFGLQALKHVNLRLQRQVCHNPVLRNERWSRLQSS